VAGLATITNAAGFVSGASAVLIGVLAGLVSYWACSVLKQRFGYDDALDTFGVHGVGGTIGALATALAVDQAIHPAAGALLEKGLLKGQLSAMGACIVLSLVATWVIAKLVDKLVGLRATEEEQAQGLDIVDHNEEGYNHS
jgi:Amt family ammonium transporter